MSGFLWTGDVAVFIRQEVCVLTQFEHPAQCLVTVFRLHSGTGAGRDETVGPILLFKGDYPTA